jgi:arabinose-5-phosphate isomerase
MGELFEIGRKVIKDECHSLEAFARRLDETAFTRCIELLLEAARERCKIFVTGIGKSRQIGDKIAATIRSTGVTALELDAVSALHGDLGMVASGDVVIALSYSGTTAEILTLAETLDLVPVQMIAVTGNPESPLASRAAVHLNVAVDREACPLNLAPTSSALCMLALGDAIAMTLMSARKVDRTEFARNHPAGALGRGLTLRAEQMMRPLNRIVVVARDQSVNEAVDAMNSRRCGAAVVQDGSGRLAGIFTHGDFARAFRLADFDPSAKVMEFMTPSPVSVSVNTCARDVLDVFQSHRIEDVVVVDGASAPVGIIDLQDVSRLGLFVGDESGM